MQQCVYETKIFDICDLQKIRVLYANSGWLSTKRYRGYVATIDQ